MTEGDDCFNKKLQQSGDFTAWCSRWIKKKKKAAPLKMCSVVFYFLFVCQAIITLHSQVRTPPSETTLFLFPLPNTWRVQKSICFSSRL